MGTMTSFITVDEPLARVCESSTLAKMGFTSHVDAFEGRFGLLHVFVTKPRFEYIEQLGKNWDIVEHPTLIKPHPSCGGTHAAMNGMLQLIKEHNINEEDVERVEVGMNQGGVDSLYYPNPKDIYEAKFSMQFVIALLLHYKRWGVDLHTQEVVDNPAMRALYPKVKFFVDEQLDKEIDRDMTDYHAIVTVFMKDGRVYRIHSHPPVLGYDEIKFKFDCNVDGIITEGKAKSIVDLIKNMERYDSAAWLKR